MTRRRTDVHVRKKNAWSSDLGILEIRAVTINTTSVGVLPLKKTHARTKQMVK